MVNYEIISFCAYFVEYSLYVFLLKKSIIMNVKSIKKMKSSRKHMQDMIKTYWEEIMQIPAHLTTHSAKS